MNTALLQKWLDLPDGLWPPEPHVLLGVPRNADPVRIQQQALARMEKLRPHQLMNPELVTEGMNRLAQALITLEKPAAVESLFAPLLVEEEESSFNLALPASPAAPVILDAEVVTAAVVTQAKPARRKRRRRRQATAEPVVAVPEIDPATVAIRHDANLRTLLKQSRDAIAAWEKLGPVLGVPGWTPVTSADVLQYLEAMTAVSQAKPSRSLSNPATLTRPERLARMVETPLPIATFRLFQKSQRDQLASDWAHGFAILRQTHAAMRQQLRSRKPRPTLKRRLLAFLRWFRRNPEWMIAVPLVVAGVITVLRFLKSSGH